MRRRGSGANGNIGDPRPVCKHGTSCYRRNPEHLEEEAHPADEDYLESCTAASVKPEFVSVLKLFEWCDSAGTGKVSKESVSKVWDVLQGLGAGVGSLDEEWEKLDNDGNGYINFSEFAEFTTDKAVSLPLGLDALRRSSVTSSGGEGQAALRCGVMGCACRTFVMRKVRCKYGAECYQKNEEHRRDFLHPDNTGWEASSTVMDKHMCCCGHKQKLHASSLHGTQLVAYPQYWTSKASSDEEFNERFPMDDVLVPHFQTLVDATYSDVTTRDRLKSCGTWMVPRSFAVESVRRNENSRLWRKYTLKREQLFKERGVSDSPTTGEADACPQATINSCDSCSSSSLPLGSSSISSMRSFFFRGCSSRRGSQASGSLPPPEFGDHGEVKTAGPWQALLAEKGAELGMTEADLPERRINEWLLFHGTSAAAAENICSHDFTMRLAGSATGTLYGRGTYLAESFTKADEYAKDEGGCFTVLLCRVLGGRVRYCDERTPNADALMADCTQGLYDCILGDRIKTSGTYREFVVFDTENIYPEYILRYTRGEFFKSPSHP